MSEQPAKHSPLASRNWGLILFVPAGMSMIIAAVPLGSGSDVGAAVVLFGFGVLTVVAGAAYYLRLPWAQKLVATLVFLGLLTLLLQRYLNLF